MNKKSTEDYTDEELLAACREYRKRWVRKHPHKPAEYQRAHIKKLARQMAEEMIRNGEISAEHLTASDNGK